jgi:RNA polymerase sigma-70 factor (ECF subfamily)
VRITVSGNQAPDLDLPLIQRLAAGELEALQELYERHKTMAYSIALRITGDVGTAEDAVQDAFLGAWRSVSRYEAGRASVRTWLLTIVHRRAIDAVRRRRPEASVEIDEGVTEALTMPDVWQEVARGLDRTTVATALAQINVDQRSAIEMAYFEGLTQTQIADRSGVPLGTVKSRLRLGLVGLRRLLTADEMRDD